MFISKLNITGIVLMIVFNHLLIAKCVELLDISAQKLPLTF
jgi:hypothetical protein